MNLTGIFKSPYVAANPISSHTACDLYADAAAVLMSVWPAE
jgi:hypothetical protein